MTAIRSRSQLGAALADSHPIDRAVYRALQNGLISNADGVAPDALTLHPSVGRALIDRAISRLQERGLVRTRKIAGGVVLSTVEHDRSWTRPNLEPCPLAPHCHIPGQYLG
jgi:hypothetical protein